ncbi:hypothetical protein DF185_15240 [Marinifilum breve]|uniref:Uncharacterized protein n=1 Tax=Marinifilum breve TaxID=2184082 RepID=A0A2V3ZUY2_9BACT|nr:hypothetical protein DF185_15240 [Marinifilum breve]
MLGSWVRTPEGSLKKNELSKCIGDSFFLKCRQQGEKFIPRVAVADYRETPEGSLKNESYQNFGDSFFLNVLNSLNNEKVEKW